MGAEVWGRREDSLAPLVIRGKELTGITYSLPVPSAQVKSALLFAALYASGDTTLIEPLPSRDHSERMLRAMGANLETDGRGITLHPSGAPLSSLDLYIPGDISSAAYWIVGGTIHPDAHLKIVNTGVNPTRTGLIDVLLEMGAKIKVENQRWEGGEPVADLVVQSSELAGISIGGEIIPRLIDELPLLAVAACAATGTTIIRDAAELRVKESDRIATTVRELSRLGAKIRELPDGMEIEGGTPLVGAECESHGDHRLAMTLGIASLIARGETLLQDAEAVAISYPDFWEDRAKLCGFS
jgi:3-phosphoshikimate 1-carboxyvinyltransferase